MNKEIITEKQGIAIITMFIMGSTLVLGIGGEAKQDVWISILLSGIFAVPILIMYAKILSYFPEQDIFEILESIFGPIMGRIFILAFSWYAFHLGALVIRNFGEFINTVSLPETPQYIIFLAVVLAIWINKEGIEVIGRFSEFTLPFLVVIIIFIVSLSLVDSNMENLKPILEQGVTPVINGAFSIFAFPLGETVLLLSVFHHFKNVESTKKVYLIGLIIGGFIILIISLRNIVVLGPNVISMLYFPSYLAVSKINIGEFIQRIEITVSLVFIFTGFIKVSICLLASSKGLSKIFKINNYKLLVTPLGLLMANLAYLIYDDIIEMENWAFKIYKYYAFPFQVLIPIIILIGAWFKVKKLGQV